MTDRLPKPLVPLFDRPLVDWILRACRAAGIGRFAINTHHLPEAWAAFGQPSDDAPGVCGLNGLASRRRLWNGCPVDLFHEPVLLETGGGLKNIEPWVADEPLLVHNGDLFSSLPLGKLIAAHEFSGLPVTLALRSEGEQKRVAVNPGGTRVTDLRGILGRGPGTHVFTGIYCIEPGFLTMLRSNEAVQVVPALIELAKQERLGAVVLDEGDWLDLGDRESYLAAHRSLALTEAVDASAQVGRGAVVERSSIGPGAVIGAGAVVRDSVVWPGGRVADGADLENCIVFSGSAAGRHRDADL